MTSKFPSPEWLNDFHNNLNTDSQYASIASRWEGDISLVIEPDDSFPGRVTLYFDLWHGESRGVEYVDPPEGKEAAFTVSAPFTNWLRILKGDLNPVQAMATMKLKVRGNMAYIMRNVPTVIDFTRVAQDTPFQE